MVDWEHFVKPLGFIVLYVAFAVAVRSILKKLLPVAANWGFVILLVAGFAVLYYVYYEAFYLIQEIIWPSWVEGEIPDDVDMFGATLQPILYVLSFLFFAGATYLFLQGEGLNPEYYTPLALGLLFLVAAIVTTYFDDELQDD
ncbi:hypothetical protein KJ765_01655 [Candidatus Micrarchaeota archaeon]|nr:hypothetical protein [Candidatus Micrarchaeota archaeon]